MARTLVTSALILALFSDCSTARQESDKQDQGISTEELLTETVEAKPDSSGYFSQEEFSEVQEKAKLLYQRDLTEAEEFTLYQAEVDLLSIPGQPVKPTQAALIDTLKRFQRCLTFDPAPETVQKTFQMKGLRLLPAPGAMFSIPLAFHIIQNGNSAPVTTAELRVQIDSLNKAYLPVRIQFTLQHVCRPANPAWDKCFPDDYNRATYNAFVAMTNQLSVNHLSTINVYINNLPALGIATFPWDVARHNTKQDVVLINPVSLPGRSLPSNGTSIAMEGNTLVHELGHFLGLFHTFHFETNTFSCNDLVNYDGCAVGDDVSDTPPQKICHFAGCGECDGDVGCDPCQRATTCNTCNDTQGNDPVDNYMGYNPDRCMNKFSPGQYSRITAMLHSPAHRRHLIRQMLPAPNQ